MVYCHNIHVAFCPIACRSTSCTRPGTPGRAVVWTVSCRKLETTIFIFRNALKYTVSAVVTFCTSSTNMDSGGRASVNDTQIATLHQQIEAAEAQLVNLKLQLQHAEQQAEVARHIEQAYQGGFPAEWISEALGVLQQDADPPSVAQRIRQDDAQPGFLHSTPFAQSTRRWPLEGEEYKRYGRQMIMPEVGLHGQLHLKNSKVLIVGLGGLGCPAAAYLAGAGVGTLGLVDGDTVETSNLHRQIAHASTRVGTSKVDSAYQYLKSYVRSHSQWSFQLWD